MVKEEIEKLYLRPINFNTSMTMGGTGKQNRFLSDLKY